MPQTITATYEHGVFVPQTPVDLPEHTVVILVLPKKHAKQPQMTDSEARFLSLRGICSDLGGLDAVEMQRKIRSEWRGQ
jgi:predicted DNA-binding antitoxin AbrB/MazE fold protein